MSRTTVRAFLFDLDGTLADTLGDIAFSVNLVLQQHGFPIHPDTDYRMMVGDGFSRLMERALPAHAVQDHAYFNRLKEEASQCYQDNALRSTKVFPGILGVLLKFFQLGVPCAVLTNKPDHLAKLLIAELFPEFKFLAVAGDMPGKQRKPNPSQALEIVEKSGIPPSEWAMVGDSGVDMEMALRAGMLPCGCLWGYRSAYELQKSGAKHLLSTPEDLLALV